MAALRALAAAAPKKDDQENDHDADMEDETPVLTSNAQVGGQGMQGEAAAPATGEVDAEELANLKQRLVGAGIITMDATEEQIRAVADVVGGWVQVSSNKQQRSERKA